MEQMTEKTRELLNSYVESCEQNKLLHVCKKIKTESGKKEVVGRLFELLQENKSWTPQQCLASIEYELNEQKYY